MTDDIVSHVYMADHPDATPRLNAALAKAQGAMQPAKKESVNPFFSTPGKTSLYADLAAIIESIRGPFAANGLSFVQLCANDDKGVTVTTRLLHASGESINSSFWVPVVKRDPQGYGSASTYARRFGLQALAGVAADVDDDGNSHVVDPKAKTAADYTKKAKEPKPIDVSKLVAAFAGLGVTSAALEERLGHPLAEVTEAEVSELRAYHASKKLMATETPEALALRLEKEAAEKGIAAESKRRADEIAAEAIEARKRIDAQMTKMDGPTKPDAVAAVKVFAGLVDEVRAATTSLAVTLIESKAAAMGLTEGDRKALARTATDRRMVLDDSARQAKVKKAQNVEDIEPKDVPR